LNEKDVLLSCRVLDLYEMVNTIETLFFEKISDALFIVNNHNPLFLQTLFQLIQEKSNTPFKGETLR
jgi:hypothetical protein